MTIIIFMIFVFAWILSVVQGLKVSVTCGVLSFFFMPIAQLIFCIYEESMRGITMVLIGSIIFMTILA